MSTHKRPLSFVLLRDRCVLCGEKLPPFHRFSLIKFGYLLCRLFIHSGHGDKFFNGRPPDFIDASEMTEQGLLPLLADAGDVIQLGMSSALLAQFSMIRYREPVRLVANARDKVRGRARGFKNDRLLNAGQEHPFEFSLRSFFPAPRLGKAENIRFSPHSLPFKGRAGWGRGSRDLRLRPHPPPRPPPRGRVL